MNATFDEIHDEIKKLTYCIRALVKDGQSDTQYATQLRSQLRELKSQREALRQKRIAAFSTGYTNGNYASAYTTQCREWQVEASHIDHEEFATEYQAGAALGFWASFKDSECPEVVCEFRNSETNRNLCKQAGITQWWE